ncbi:MAG: restriction endonuclease [Rikenellaceae bacterium]|nr:restriction endonuclease [Rikenellaceae bacterium]
MTTTIDQQKLQSLIESYKSDFPQHIGQEIYKWRAIAHFQKYWDIEADDFTSMLKLALDFKDDNLLAGAMYFPKRMIWRFAEFDEVRVKQMFIDLFDENNDLAKRINAFTESADDILKRWNPEKNHYQKDRAISTYLWLMFPDKYYIYKADCVKALLSNIGIDYKRQNKLKGRNVVNVYNIYDQVAEILRKDAELHQLLDAVLDEECYKDPMYRTVVIDFAYYLKEYYNKQTIISQNATNEQRIWLYAPGENARMWNACLQDSKMYLGWDPLENLSLYSSREAMKEKMIDAYGDKSSYTNDSLATYDFVHTVKSGDIIYVKQGLKKIIGRGTVVGDYEYHPERVEYKNARSVKWDKNGEWNVDNQLPMKTLTDITKYPNLTTMLQLMVEDNGEHNSSVDVKESYSKEKFLKEVYISASEYDHLYALLERKKNVILQGAPGVGKTFTAKRLAYAIMGEMDESRIEFVQFHQNYSYEDFVMGYKPTSDGGFELRAGVFHKFCNKAANDPNRKYFFIIDEINRGNLSKIFGELLMLIESDYRYKGDDKNMIRLAYSDKPFSVPNNLYIIGMMNTADRSLAMIDYALRRRFSFFSMKPGFDSEGFKEYQKVLNNDKFNALINKTKELNVRISELLGSGFEIGHSYFCNQTQITDEWLHSVVNYDIIPMLEEYWFDNSDEVNKWRDNLTE